MAVSEGRMDDGSFGYDSGGRFKETINKQLIAAVPNWIAKSALEVPDEIRKRAEAKDKEAILEARRLTRAKLDFETSLHNKPKPKALEFNWDGVPGYLYIPTWTSWVHFLENKQGVFTCKKHEFREQGKLQDGEESPCCMKAGKDAAKNMAVLLMVYEVDHKGNIVEIEQMLREPLDDTHDLFFNYTYQAWGLSGKKGAEWVDAQLNFPAISSDFHVWKKSPDQYAETTFAATGNSLYQSLGDEMIKRVVLEGRKHYDSCARTASGQDLTYEQMIAKWVTNPQAVGSQGRPVSSSRDFLSPGR